MTDLFDYLINEKLDPESDWAMKHHVVCTKCECLVPVDWIEDKDNTVCYMCTPMTKEDWEIAYGK